ncbi:signal peptidase I [Halalkalibacter nanhaiisediminis]|uniref:Signal peptidase I n=1 Tax=Halalkalibacter nanhaiisediminis TaxID=688079 RepID=A0A562QEF8_9BACI|nr:signal peptidase I [Halalkalibacter nanhaiisediminis]TWI55138.1 signal peptidase I [Halalkalibacter nanhaiisediminis]
MSEEKKESWEWLKAIVVALVLAFLIRQFLFAPVVVDGESMMPTLEHNDRMIINKIGYIFDEPKRFDIIVFHAPAGKDYIKRVIGLPGDTIEYRDDILYVNGEAIAEPYLDELKQIYDGGSVTGDFKLVDVTTETVVPEDELFVLGDNRRHSKDSRDIGTVHIDEVVGRANVVFWPLTNIGIAK